MYNKFIMNKEQVIEKLNKVIDEEINPKLNEHLGGVILKNVEGDIATVTFTGSCKGCYAAEDTLENVVKKIIFSEVPEVKEVYLDNSVSDDILDFARSLMSRGK